MEYQWHQYMRYLKEQNAEEDELGWGQLIEILSPREIRDREALARKAEMRVRFHRACYRHVELNYEVHGKYTPVWRRSG